MVPNGDGKLKPSQVRNSFNEPLIREGCYFIDVMTFHGKRLMNVEVLKDFRIRCHYVIPFGYGLLPFYIEECEDDDCFSKPILNHYPNW